LARRKRRLTFATLVLVALALATGVWAGGGAGFTRVTTTTGISSGTGGTGAVAAAVNTATTTGTTVTATLHVDFKDVFGSADVATITGSVDHASFFWECFNNSGKNPKATNKGVVEVPGSVVTQNFPVDKNGNVTGFLDFSSSADLSSVCPSGQETHVFAVFVKVHLTDNMNHSFDVTPDPTTGTIIL
jgi:hypothetical protein